MVEIGKIFEYRLAFYSQSKVLTKDRPPFPRAIHHGTSTLPIATPTQASSTLILSIILVTTTALNTLVPPNLDHDSLTYFLTQAR